MFSGIVESKQPILGALKRDQVVEIHIKKPKEFNDLKIGHSICTDGICLTLENFDEEKMIFALAAETLQVVGWTDTNALVGKLVNLERSLKFSDRVHGHFVAGHVDGVGEITSMERQGESLLMSVKFPEAIAPLIWKKGCVAINGVSLTVNWVEGQNLGVCLVPETIKQTNFLELKLGELVNIEADAMARAWRRSMEPFLPDRTGAKRSET